MRRNYKMPSWIKANVENELQHYYNNLEIFEAEKQNIIDESPPPSDGQPQGKGGTGDPTLSKVLKMNTRTMMLIQVRLDGITKVKNMLSKEDQELFQLMYKDGFTARLARTYKGISEDTFYGFKRKIQYLVAIELGYI